ncbi:MAG: GNAT family N-acetyltransferase [Pseudomonadota bacterium]
MKLVSLDQIGSDAWDKTVDQLHNATLFHKSCWAEILHQGLGLKTHYLAAEQDGAITGLLPLAGIRRPLHKDLVSLPLATLCGCIAVDDESRRFLIEAAGTLAKKDGARLLELRHRNVSSVQSPHATFTKEIPSDAENLLWIPNKRRADVRKAMELGLSIHTNQDLQTFARWYDRATQQLGSPGLGVRPLLAIGRGLAEKDFCVHWVMHQGQPVMGVMTYYFQQTVIPYYAAAFAKARDLKAAPFVYAQIASQAVAQGYSTFDFGRSLADSGAFSFKKNFGFSPQHLSYERISPHSKPLPPQMTQPPAWLSQAWRYTPHALARAFIPAVRNMAV